MGKFDFENFKNGCQHGIVLAEAVSFNNSGKHISFEPTKLYFLAMPMINDVIFFEESKRAKNNVILPARLVAKYLYTGIYKDAKDRPTIKLYFLKNIGNLDYRKLNSRFFCSCSSYSELDENITLISDEYKYLEIKKSQIIQVTKENIKRVFDVVLSQVGRNSFEDDLLGIRFAYYNNFTRKFDASYDANRAFILNSEKPIMYPLTKISRFPVFPVEFHCFLQEFSSVASLDEKIKNENLREVYKSIIRYRDVSDEEEKYIRGEIETFSNNIIICNERLVEALSYSETFIKLVDSLF